MKQNQKFLAPVPALSLSDLTIAFFLHAALWFAALNLGHKSICMEVGLASSSNLW